MILVYFRSAKKVQYIRKFGFLKWLANFYYTPTLPSSIDVQFLFSSFIFNLSFHTLMVVPSSEAGEPYPCKLRKGLPCL
jgi:hypothetical protein